MKGSSWDQLDEARQGFAKELGYDEDTWEGSQFSSDEEICSNVVSHLQ